MDARCLYTIVQDVHHMRMHTILMGSREVSTPSTELHQRHLS